VIERAVRAEGDNEGFKGFKLGEVDIGELSFTPPDVDEAQAWQIVIPLESTSGAGEGLEPNFYLELVLLREGDTTARAKRAAALRRGITLIAIRGLSKEANRDDYQSRGRSRPDVGRAAHAAPPGQSGILLRKAGGVGRETKSGLSAISAGNDLGVV
jgi:hypothetical protein